VAARAINFWNPEKAMVVEGPQAVRWQSVTTGGTSGVELLLAQARSGTLRLETPLVRHEIATEAIGLEDIVLEAGGLGRRVRIFRLPEEPSARTLSFEGPVELRRGEDNPIYARLVLEDGHVAWSSPVYASVAPGG